MTDGVAPRPGAGTARALPAVMIFLVVTGIQLLLVRAAGTDVPFQDQWDVEGRAIYPEWRAGTLAPAEGFRAHNEHRIAWTHAVNLLLFSANGDRWDPLVQLTVNALLHGFVAALIGWFLLRGRDGIMRWMLACAVVVLTIPLAGWHNALWGFQSQVYFVLLFAVAAMGLLTAGPLDERRAAGGWLAACAGVLAMGAGALMPVAVLMCWLLRGTTFLRKHPVAIASGVAVMIAAVWLRVNVPEHAGMRAASVGEFLVAFARMAAWPHVDQPLAAAVMNVPLIATVWLKFARKFEGTHAEEFAVALGFFGILVAGASAWARGGSDEFAVGLPSRYVDFATLVPLANLVCLLRLALLVPVRWRFRWLTAAWVGFLLIGWTSVSWEAWRRVIVPRANDRDAPVRVVRTYQVETRDPRAFAAVPRLLLPHPNLGSVGAVLDDPRMQGALPPSLQPQEKLGPLSRGVRRLLGR